MSGADGNTRHKDRPEPLSAAVLLRDGSDPADVRKAVEAAGFVVLGSPDSRDPSTSEPAPLPSVVVAEAILPDGSATSVVGELRANAPNAFILVTGTGEKKDWLLALDAGADDYLPSPVDVHELAARLRAAARRLQALDLRAIRLGNAELVLSTRTLTVHETEHRLTPNEFEMLCYFMRRAGTVATREQLLRDVLHVQFAPGTNVLEVNISRLRRRLKQARANLQLVVVPETGYTLDVADE
jgi:two-component system KDP operon response regulator KdpE